MPCYLFTYHGHATWMPDHPKGYVHRKDGLHQRAPEMAGAYRRNQRETAVFFDDDMQAVLVETARSTATPLDITIHAVATEPTHVHVLASWTHDRPWKSLRASIRSALTRALNERFGRRTWFSDSPSRKRVRDHAHFDYLVLEYLPKHSGARWMRLADVEAAKGRAGADGDAPGSRSDPAMGND